MSDVEDYAYSPYDDLEEILYDADPAPELADDLAEHALHSPVYLDEVAGFELQEYFSDWEYYSDDYMDDDPALLSKEKKENKEKNILAEPVKRGRKRKLAETADKPLATLRDADLILRPLRGTVWADTPRPGSPSYKVGQGDSVAFLKDWKEIFSIKDDGWNRKSSGADNDESWAKDMSLADMGLGLLHREKSFEQQRLESQEEYEDEEEGDDDDDDDGIDNTELEDIAKEHGNGGMGDLSIDDHGDTVHEFETSDEEGYPRKRRRYKAGLPSPPISSEAVGGRTLQTEQLDQEKRTGREVDSGQSRKRKASDEMVDGEAGPLRSSARNHTPRSGQTPRRTSSGRRL